MKLLFIALTFVILSVPASSTRLQRRALPGFCGNDPETKQTIKCGQPAAPCCSQWHNCGYDIPYCGQGCQEKFGLCNVGEQSDGPTPSFCGIDPTTEETIKCKNPESPCCSKDNKCGSDSQSCEAGCQREYGLCGAAVQPGAPPAGFCGIFEGETIKCEQAEFPCCSKGNYCGNKPAYCGQGCRKEFGLRCGSKPGEEMASPPPAGSCGIHNGETIKCEQPGFPCCSKDKNF